MCAIAGFSGSFDPRLLETTNDLQEHRGPDDAGTYHDPHAQIGLAHRRLSIIDLSPSGHQPMTTPDGAVTLVFNGEIYNYRELRRELELEGCIFRGASDTEVLLQLYVARGDSMLPRLNGIFAFALWDSRDASLLLARDALGVKPLYYANVPSGFAFASEVKALLALVPQARDLDYAALHRYLTFLWCPGEGTALRAVRKLGPGEALRVRAGSRVERFRWYDLPVCRGVRPELTQAEAVSGTVDGLRRAVNRQLVADVPVGAFLSGGLDSSAIVTFARERAPGIRCFTIDPLGGQEAGTSEDLPYARRVARHLGVELEVVQVSSEMMAGELPAMVGQLDEPLADPAPLNVLYISRLAREHGAKVLLSGAGGDDLFTGYRRHVAVRYENLWSWMPERLLYGVTRAAAALDQRNPLFRRATKALRAAASSGDQRVTSYFSWATEEDLRALYSDAFRAQLDATAADEPMREFLARLPDTLEPLEKMLALEQRFFLTDHNLIYTDKMSMRASVEVRVPFLDLDLVEHAARVPLHLKQRGSEGKWVLKKAMEPYLPKDVIYRPKTGFGAPVRRWLRHELRGMLDEVLSPNAIKRRGLFDPQAVQRLVAADSEGRIDATYTILSLVCCELWCRRFVDAV